MQTGRGGRAAMGCGTLVLIVGAWVGVAIWHQRHTSADNAAKARATTAGWAHDFAEQARAAAELGPLTQQQLQSLGRTAGVNSVHAVSSGGSIVVTFGAIDLYSIPGSISGGEVDLCYSESISRSGKGVTDTLSPMSCADLPVTEPAEPTVSLPPATH